MIVIFISGKPAPQGSKRHVGNGTMIESCKAVKPWRESIRSALTTDAGRPQACFSGPVACKLEFVLKRPKSTPKRSTPPAVKKPDIDKLERAVLDAITSSGVINDDSQVVELQAIKRLAELNETPGLYLCLADHDGFTKLLSERHHSAPAAIAILLCAEAQDQAQAA